MTDILELLGPWVGMLTTVCFWSYLYKETALFRVVEYTFIGFAVAHATVMGVNRARDQLLTPLMVDADFLILVPIILGLMYYARFFKEYRFVTRLPICIMAGVSTGLALRTMAQAQILKQVRATMLLNPLIDGLIIAIFTVGTLVYFIFASEENVPASLTPIIHGARRIGRLGIMFAMGAAFASLLVTRYTMAISRVMAIVKVLLGA